LLLPFLSECPSCNLAFLLDASSKSTNDWQNILNFVNNLVTRFNINQNCVRVAVIRYALSADVSIPLNRFNDVNSLRAGINSLTIIGGGSNLATALQVLRLQVFASFASNVVRPGATLVAGIVTDRLTCSSQITTEAANLRNGMRVHIVGVAITETRRVDTGCLRGLVTPNQYAESATYNQLNRYVGQVGGFLCVSTAPRPSRMCL